MLVMCSCCVLHLPFLVRLYLVDLVPFFALFHVTFIQCGKDRLCLLHFQSLKHCYLQWNPQTLNTQTPANDK